MEILRRHATSGYRPINNISSSALIGWCLTDAEDGLPELQNGLPSVARGPRRVGRTGLRVRAWVVPMELQMRGGERFTAVLGRKSAPYG